ncbi:MAG: molybdenum cofactor biosynthesis protein MoaE [Candidatus Methylomirabilis oxygeniifera]|uniref:Molybdopterin synthase catalytic subunit n=1 Tax=Methylomirabilis oxygeniifera TaxID=671143 RepID=D5MEV7_METO1|nr:MAG: molybdenum cofactor biosynthesis protein MoaE [Candidatus Methylomirabilis oxyfera]CBE68286.1 Molybdopterin-converting factor subunit 2 (Molybdopterin synthase subunit 2) (MPT synthase subunit 2) (Molybdenum cofactor biosynthesis protein E) (Molybdopterin-converting factor large subunit) [Candidatus Methylomirabilis oxyfera]
MFEITDQPLSLEPLVTTVKRSSSGAIATFLGVVREQTQGRQVRYLEYEAYREMAIPKMREIADEIRRKWEIDEVAMVHRVGRLQIGEASVAIAVSAPHRHAALTACAYAIDRLKEVVPIWKKEVWTDGEEWAGPGICDHH